MSAATSPVSGTCASQTERPRHRGMDEGEIAIRSLVITGLLALTAPAQAQDLLSCYARNYSDAHLAQNPDQVVQSIVLAFERGAGDLYVTMAAKIADGGHARGGPLVGQWVDQGLYCYEGEADAVGAKCAVECDGGSLEVTKVTGDSLTFRTQYLTVGDTEECGGSIDLAERPGQPVSYKLSKADFKHCEALLR